MNNVIKDRRKMILAIAIPIIIQNIVQHVMISTDRAFLGNLDAKYLASVGNVVVPYNTLLFCFFSLSVGLTVLIAQSIGAKDIRRAQKLGESSFVFNTLVSVGLFLFWQILGGTVLKAFGAKGEILRDAVTYVRILSISYILFGIEITVASILQGVGVTRPIMIFGIIKSVLNAFLAWVMVFGKLGLPAMGLEGAAWATTISSIVGALGLVAVIFFLKDILPFHLSPKEILQPNWKLYKDSLNVGLPSAMESLLWSSGQLVMTFLLNRIDGMAIGIFSVVQTIQMVGLFIYMGIAKAAMTMVGQYWGEESYDKARATGYQCMRMSLAITAFFGVIFLIFPEALARIFTKDTAVIDRAVPLIRWVALTIQFQAVNVITGHAIRGTGDTKWMLGSQIFGTTFVISLSSLLIFGLSWGLLGVYITVLLDEAVRGGINYLRFVSGENPFLRFITSKRVEEA